MTQQELAQLDAELFVAVAEIRAHYEKAVTAGGDATLNPERAAHRMYSALTEVETTTRRALGLLDRIRDHQNHNTRREAA